MEIDFDSMYFISLRDGWASSVSHLSQRETRSTRARARQRTSLFRLSFYQRKEQGADK